MGLLVDFISSETGVAEEGFLALSALERACRMSLVDVSKASI